ncbi:MAG: hypothetical protein Q8P77_01125 [Candidatus Veblenbacteria bacterium]|nr:hypothetical protein [Candidatus Veblenbacteria bacterium]
MAELQYSESFLREAQARLADLAASNSKEIPYGEAFPNFSVVVGDTEKQVITVLIVPEELKEKIGDKAYVVTE